VIDLWPIDIIGPANPAPKQLTMKCNTEASYQSYWCLHSKFVVFPMCYCRP